MKYMNTHSLRGLSIPLVTFLLCIPLTVDAATFITGDAPTVPKSKTVTDDAYLFGGNASVGGSIIGDLIAGAGSVLVNGSVAGDVIAAGGTVSVLSDVRDDIRVAGGTVIIQSAVDGDVLAAGGQVTLSGDGIRGDVAVAGGTVRIDAPVAGELRAAAGDLYINTEIRGDVYAQVERVTLGPKAHIMGRFEYKAPVEAVMETGAKVSGEVAYSKGADLREAARTGVVAFLSVWVVAKFLMIFSGALVLSYAFQRYSRELVLRSSQQPLPQFIRGLVFFIVTPIASLILLMTLVGTLFGIIGFMALALLAIFGMFAAPLVIGAVAHKALFKTAEYDFTWKAVLLGTILYFALGLVPLIGWALKGVLACIVVGAMLSLKREIAAQWR